MSSKKFCLIIICLGLILSFTPVHAGAASYKPDFNLSSEAVELVNLDTEMVIYQKNQNQRMEPASITKIMTFIIVSEHMSDIKDTRITVKKEIIDRLLGTDSSMSGIKSGDVLTAYQLSSCMLIHSGNDAATVLADYVGKGNVDEFISLMNQKAKELNCKDTHFTNPDGLHDTNHYTTASDLVKITRYALTLPYFNEITSKTRESYTPVGGPEQGKQRLLTTTNLLIDKNSGAKYYYKYAQGIKTGHTDQSGYCLVSKAIAEGYSYLCVVLGSPSVDANGKAIAVHNEMIDTRNLYRWAFKSFDLKSIITRKDSCGEIKLNYAWNKDKLLLNPEKDYSTMLPNEVSASSIVITKNIPEHIDAPVKKGQIIGTATLSYATQQLATINLVASESVERSEFLKTQDVVKSILTSTWFIVIIAIIILLIIIYILLLFIYKRKVINLRKVKKYRKL